MTGAVLAALWLMLAPPPAPVLAPSPAPSQDVIQTQPSPAGAPPAVQPAPTDPPPRPARESAPEEPQTPSPPDVQGQGAQAQQAWEQRLHAAYDTAEARQGPLDGRWKLTGPNGDALFVMVFSDPGGGNLARPASRRRRGRVGFPDHGRPHVGWGLYPLHRAGPEPRYRAAASPDRGRALGRRPDRIHRPARGGDDAVLRRSVESTPSSPTR